MEKDKISVIVPIYNVEKYIHRCIASILSQSYKNLEVILVDDGSPDNCPKLCDEYARQDTRVQVIHKSNGGLSSARNAGLDKATGQYISFVDGDDYIDIQMLEQLYAALEKSKADYSVCNLQYVDEYGRKLVQFPNDYLKDERIDRDTVFLKSLEENGYFFVVVWNKLFKRKLWESYRFSEGKYHEDEFAFHHILRQCKNVICLKEVYYYYVQHTGSIMAVLNEKRVLDKLEALLERMVYYKKNQMVECLALQDQRSFWLIREGYKLCDSKEDKRRYCILKKKYYRMHHWIVDNSTYPKIKRMLIALFYLFPFSIRIYDWIRKYYMK